MAGQAQSEVVCSLQAPHAGQPPTPCGQGLGAGPGCGRGRRCRGAGRGSEGRHCWRSRPPTLIEARAAQGPLAVQVAIVQAMIDAAWGTGHESVANAVRGLPLWRGGPLHFLGSHLRIGCIYFKHTASRIATPALGCPAVPVFGNSLRNSINRGYLYGAIVALT